MNHHATPDFWKCYKDLPAEIKPIVDRCFKLLRENPSHSSLHFKRVGKSWSARAGLYYRAVGRPEEDGVTWFWIGKRKVYPKVLRR